MDTFPSTRERFRAASLFDARLGLFFLVVSLGMTLVLSFNLISSSQVNLVVGEPAPEDVFAPRSITYTSEVLTRQAQEQARNSVPDIYTPLDLSIGRAQLAQARAIFAFIDTVRADVDASTEEKITYLQTISGIVVEESVARDLLSMSEADYQTAKSEVLRIIDDLMREEIRATQLEQFQRLARQQASLGLTPAQSNVVSSLAWQFIVPTVFPDEEATAEARDEAAAAVEPVTRTIVQNQRIVRAGDIVTAADVEAVTELGLMQAEFNWQRLLSLLLLSCLSTAIIVLYWVQFGRVYGNGRSLVLLAGLILFFVIAGKAMTATSGSLVFLYPLAALSMLLAVVFDVRFSIVVTVILAALIGVIAPNSLQLAIYVAVGGIMAVLTLRDANRVVAFFRAGLIAAAGYILVMLIYAIPQQVDTFLILQQTGYAVANGMLSAALTLVGFYVVGGLFGIITILQLQDLSRLDHPLLQELLRRAPGTYHHSIMVANLAEQAAERVGANATLVRVGAFYHDIGKMNRPPFFTENQEGANPHDSLDAYTSARIIIGHVTDGLELARRYRLPNRIRDFIAQHHGTRVVKGFYMKARAQAGEDADEVDADQFRYPGPRPQSREAGIVMLADAVEATSSAVRPNTPAAIEKLVNTIVDDDLMEGQLNASGLTLGDVAKIRMSLIESLKGRYHVRVKYPGNEALTAENVPEGDAEQELRALPPPSHPALLPPDMLEPEPETVRPSESLD